MIAISYGNKLIQGTLYLKGFKSWQRVSLDARETVCALMLRKPGYAFTKNENLMSVAREK